MANRKRKTTLYFTKGSRLTDEDVANMDAIPGGAVHRNASLIDPDAKLEPADAVAGPAIPQAYREKYEVVEGYEADETEDAGDADSMTVPELKAALDEAEVEYPANAKKADLVALYNEHVAE